MHTQTGVRCTCNAGPTGKIQSNLKNKQKKKETLFCGENKASRSKKKIKTVGNQQSLSGLPSRCIIRKTRVFCSLLLLIIRLLSLWWLWIAVHHLSHNPSVQVLTPNTTSPCRCNGLPRHHSPYRVHVEVLKFSSGVYHSLYIKPSKVFLTKHTSAPMQNSSKWSCSKQVQHPVTGLGFTQS